MTDVKSSIPDLSPPPWHESAATLIDVATGRRPADLVIRNGRWVNVHSGEIVGSSDVAIVALRPRLSTPMIVTWCRVSAMRICM